VKKLIPLFILIIPVLFLLQFLFGQKSDKRNYEFMSEMVRSDAYKAQSPNSFFGNRLTQQNPVKGTIARGYMPIHFGSSPEESIRAGNELENPFAQDSTNSLARGKEVFENFCRVCHGISGEGDGAVSRRGFPTPPSLLLDNARNMKDGQMFHIITYGFKNMPAYASQINREDRWHSINYVRKLQEKQQ